MGETKRKTKGKYIDLNFALAALNTGFAAEWKLLKLIFEMQVVKDPI